MQLKAFQQDIVDRIGELPRFAEPYVYKHVVVPTGGGKTVILIHSISAVMAGLAKGFVLILTPSDAITQQTLRRLQSAHHPYRQALNREMGGPDAVRVLSLDQAMAMDPNLPDHTLVVLVINVQAFKKSKSDTGTHARLKVQRRNSQFRGRSLVEIIQSHRPYVIFDESHKGATELTDALVDSLTPRLVVGFTATPPAGADLLCDPITGVTLRSENLIRLPLQLYGCPTWTVALDAAMDRRQRLEDLYAAEDGLYVRPILLLQAEQEKESSNRTTVADIEQQLRQRGVPDEQVRVVTGKRNNLEATDALIRPDNPVRFIITVDALMEGWDFGFAQVLCTFKQYKSGTAATQIIGRIMRMYGGRPAGNAELNQAFIYAASRVFTTTAKAVLDRLQGMYGGRFHARTGEISTPEGLADKQSTISPPEIGDPLPPDMKAIKSTAQQKRLPIWALDPCAIPSDWLLAAVRRCLRQRMDADTKMAVSVLDLNAQGHLGMSTETAQSALTHLSPSLFVQRVAKHCINLSVSDVTQLLPAVSDRGWDTEQAVGLVNSAVDRIVASAMLTNGHRGHVGGTWAPPSTAKIDPTQSDDRNVYGFSQADMNPEEARFIRWFVRSRREQLVALYVRNPARRTRGYPVPLYPRNHFPDFVAWLDDGSVEALEYKGAHLKKNDDTLAKYEWGQMWAKAVSAAIGTAARYSQWVLDPETGQFQKWVPPRAGAPAVTRAMR